MQCSVSCLCERTWRTPNCILSRTLFTQPATCVSIARQDHPFHLSLSYVLFATRHLFNFGKCKCLHTGHGNEDAQYTMGDIVLNTTLKEKDLGLTISADMNISEQCGIAAAKGNQILGLIRRNIVYKEKELIIPLYKTIVRPHLEYCIQAWRPYRKKDIDMLERVQRRATKMIPKLRNISYEMRLKECGLTTLETRRLRGDQIEVFKILNGYENIDRNIFFSQSRKREGLEDMELH